MAVTARVYGKAPLAWLNKEVDLIDDAIHAMLHSAAYTPDQDVHDYVNDLAGEIAAAGYTAGGQALAGKTLTYDAPTNTVTFDANDVVYAGVSFTVRTVTVHDRATGADTTRPLICYQQSDADVVSTNGEWRCQWNAGGIFTVTVA